MDPGIVLIEFLMDPAPGHLRMLVLFPHYYLQWHYCRCDRDFDRDLLCEENI